MNPGLAQELLVQEAALLDAGRLNEWLAMLTDDIRYRVPAGPAGAGAGSGFLYIIDDGRAELEERIWRINESGLNHSQDPPTRQMRCISNVRLEPVADPLEIKVSCYTVLWEIKSGSHEPGQPVHCHPMQCDYVWRRMGEDWRIARKTLLLLEAAAPLGALTNIL